MNTDLLVLANRAIRDRPLGARSIVVRARDVSADGQPRQAPGKGRSGGGSLASSSCETSQQKSDLESRLPIRSWRSLRLRRPLDDVAGELCGSETYARAGLP